MRGASGSTPAWRSSRVAASSGDRRGSSKLESSFASRSIASGARPSTLPISRTAERVR